MSGSNTAISRRRLLQGAGAMWLLSVSQVSLAAVSQVVAVRVWPASSYTRVTVESNRQLKYKQFALSNPERVVVDIEDVNLNQAKLRELMADKPFGAGLGHGGGKAKTFAPDAPLSQIPTDSWFVMVWVETGVVGILLHIGILLYILARGAYLVIFKLRNTQLRGFTAALTAGISGIVVMAYANEILGQIPTGAILYMSMGFIFLAPRFDRELARKEILDRAMSAQRPHARENYE